MAAEGVFSAGMHTHMRALRPDVEACADSAYRDYVLACLAFTEGRVLDAEKLGSQALDRFAPGDLATRAAAAVGFARMLMGAWEEAVSTCTAAIDGDAGWAAGMGRYALALCYVHLGRFDDLDHLHHRLEVDMARGVLSPCEALTVRGVINLWTGDLDEAALDLVEATERARAGDRTRMLASTLAALGDVNFRLGQWDDAAVNTELGVSLARDSEHPVGLQQAHSTAAIVHSRAGRFDLAQSHIDELTAIETALPWWGAAGLLAIGRAVLAEARGDFEAMFKAVAPLLDHIAGDPQRHLPTWPSTVVVIDALLGVAENTRAEVLLDALERFVHARQLTSPAAELARLRGRLTENSGDLMQAEAHYRSGIADPGAYVYARARTQLALGRLLRTKGRSDEATQQLLSARAQLSALGAAPDVRLCNAELATRGHPVGDTFGGEEFGLTAAELSVANLVAQRLTNREVAARLYISAKTVEYHLSHIYAKLNITGRRQLGDRLATH